MRGAMNCRYTNTAKPAKARRIITMPTGSSQELRLEAVISPGPFVSSSVGRIAPPVEEESEEGLSPSACESSSLQSWEVRTSGSLFAVAALEAS